MDRCYERYAATVAVAGMLAGGWTLLPAAATHHSSPHSSSLQRPGPWSHRPQHCCYIPRRRLAGHLSVGISGFSDSF